MRRRWRRCGRHGTRKESREDEGCGNCRDCREDPLVRLSGVLGRPSVPQLCSWTSPPDRQRGLHTAGKAAKSPTAVTSRAVPARMLSCKTASGALFVATGSSTSTNTSTITSGRSLGTPASRSCSVPYGHSAAR
jgi:hypothetical protein